MTITSDIATDYQYIEGVETVTFTPQNPAAAAAVDQWSGHIERFEPQALVKGVQGNAVPYAAVHNYGGLKMPQREFMGLHERGEQEVAELLADFVTLELWG